MAEDERLADNVGRVKHEAEIDQALSTWTSGLDSTAALAELAEAEVPSGPIYSVEDMFNDEHYQARGLFETVADSDDPTVVPAIHPRLTETPGRTDSFGPELGEHTDSVLSEVLGYQADKINTLRESGSI